MPISSSSHSQGITSWPPHKVPVRGDEVMEDLTRFGMFLLSAPVVIVAGGVVLGLIGRYVTGRR
jgi:hypothetical protein